LVPLVPRRRGVAVAIAGAATAVTVAVGAAAFAANGGSLPWAGHDHPAAASTAIAEPASSWVWRPTATPSAVPPVLPAGFTWYNSKSGFHVAWPAKWTKIQESRTSVTLCNPGGPPVIGVREWVPSDPDLGLALKREETAAGLSKYKRIQMTVAPTQDSADWEYTFTDPKMGALHGLDHVVLLNGRFYIIQWRTPAASWTANAGKRAVVLDTFHSSASPAKGSGTPSGFVSYRSRSGFSVVAPAKWGNIDETPTSVVFCAPGGPPLLGVRAWAPSNVDLAVALSREEELAKLPHYHRISIEAVPGQRDAVWEYTFTDPKFGRLHGLERAFVTPSGAYLIQWRTPADKWPANLAKLGVVTSSFGVTGG
ncbi:MAG: hypothetical protein ACJ786_09175, partial [Catenulispora sp.]